MISAKVTRPIIALTPDIEGCSQSAAESKYMIRRNYAAAIRAADGVPIILPYEPALIPSYLSFIHGLVITGGMFDIDPRLYGAEPRGPLITKEERTGFEQALLQAALHVDLPVLGICNGMQLLAVTLGGTLIQHIPTEVPKALEHMPKCPATEPQHSVKFVEGSILKRVVGLDNAEVNSVHHQAVSKAPTYDIGANSSDGVIEAIEVPTRRFCVGLQWHPEYFSSPADMAVLQTFVRAAAQQSEHR